MPKIRYALNEFPSVPLTLSSDPQFMHFEIVELYHQYYLDSYGKLPEGGMDFEYFPFITNQVEFRLVGDALGSNSLHRRCKSSALGQAFCRMFLSKHADITYFAHMDHLINKAADITSNVKVERVSSGDAPDYLCASTEGIVTCAESKGRHDDPINFITRKGTPNKEFEKWRKQFTRVIIKDLNDFEKSIKGYIVVTCFGTQRKRKNYSKLLAEDPKTIGDEPLDKKGAQQLAETVRRFHFADIAKTMGIPALAYSLSKSIMLNQELQVQVWEFIPDPNLLFIGRFCVSAEGKGIFFGLEISIFQQLVCDSQEAQALSKFNDTITLKTPIRGVSFLRDGSIFGPLNYFRPLSMKRF